MDEFEQQFSTRQERLEHINQEVARALAILAHNEDMLDMAELGALELLDDIKATNVRMRLTDQVDEV